MAQAGAVFSSARGAHFWPPGAADFAAGGEEKLPLFLNGKNVFPRRKGGSRKIAQNTSRGMSKNDTRRARKKPTRGTKKAESETTTNARETALWEPAKVSQDGDIDSSRPALPAHPPAAGPPLAPRAQRERQPLLSHGDGRRPDYILFSYTTTKERFPDTPFFVFFTCRSGPGLNGKPHFPGTRFWFFLKRVFGFLPFSPRFSFLFWFSSCRAAEKRGAARLALKARVGWRPFFFWSPCVFRPVFGFLGFWVFRFFGFFEFS